MSLIDSDWSTFTLDVDDPAIGAMVRECMHAERARPANVGSRLGDLVSAAGLVGCQTERCATQAWREWNPDQSPAPDGCFSMQSLADDLVDTGQLEQDDTARFVSIVHDAARRGRFSMSLTMYAVIGTVPR